MKMRIPALMRPTSVLAATLKYLVDHVLDLDVELDEAGLDDPRFLDDRIMQSQHITRPTASFVYGFISDRARQIRKDFTVQGFGEDDGPLAGGCISIFEQCARISIMADYELCDIPKGLGHDPQLNRQELNNCLKTLCGLYDRTWRVLRAAGRKGQAEVDRVKALLSPHEAECRCVMPRHRCVIDVRPTHTRSCMRLHEVAWPTRGGAHATPSSRH